MVRNGIFEFFSNRGFLLPSERSWHADLRGKLGKELRPEAYLEVGVYKGETFRKVSKWSRHSVGVDINPDVEKVLRRIENSTFVLGSMGRVFSELKGHGLFDLIFIDADHSKESVLLDFKFAQELLAPKGLVLLHDTWPGSKKFSAPELCGDAWAAVQDLRNQYPDWSFVTIPAHPGLTLCQRNNATPL